MKENTIPTRRLFPFMKMKGLFIGISVLALAVSIYFYATRGLNFGVDFQGGVKLIVQFATDSGEDEIRHALGENDFGEVQVVRFGPAQDKSYMIRARLNEEGTTASLIEGKLKQQFGASVNLLSEETVGAKVGADLRKRGMFAMILTWILILIYVGVRFDFLFSPGAVVALLHDVTIVLGFFAFMGKEFNLQILAALLTIIGFSVNDTIIIYDRIRENLSKYGNTLSREDLVNLSVNETLSRTIITSLTVLFVVGVLYFFGGVVLKDFAFAMIVGVVAGSYSTIFVASPLYLLLYRFFPKKGLVVKG